MPSISNSFKICFLFNAVLCKIPLFQRDPPLHKIRIPLPLPFAEPPGLLIGRAGDEYSYIIIGCKAGMMAVASLHDGRTKQKWAKMERIGEKYPEKYVLIRNQRELDGFLKEL